MRVFIFILTVFLIGHWSLSGQSEQDTLWSTWQDNTLPDTVRLAAIQRVAWQTIRQNPDSSEILARLQLELAEKIGHKMWQSKALNTIGVSHYIRDEYSPALQYYLKSLELKDAIGDLSGEASLHENISMVYSHLGRQHERLEHLERAIIIHEQLKDTLSMSSAMNKLANLYFDQSDYSKALEYYFLSIDLRSNDSDSSSLAMTLSNIGAAYNGQRKFKEALQYYHKSLSIRKNLSDEPGIAILYNNIADVYLGLNQLDSANYYIFLAIDIMTLRDNKYGLANAFFQLGQIAIKSDKIDQAIRWCRQSLDISKSIGALVIERNACQCLYQSYRLQKNFTQALQYHEQFISLSDSLQQGEIDLKLNQLELERDYLRDSLIKQEEKLKMEVYHQKNVRNKNRRSGIFLILVLVGSLMGLAFLSRSVLLRKRIKRFQGKADELQKQQLINEASILKTQVNPHFLFNSLSILTALVHKDPELAEKFIDQLSKSYRYILEQKDQSLVTLRTELDFIKSYVFLLKIRFQNKFQVHYRFNELQLDSNMIAPMTLQLLIENAVKHNKMSEQHPLNIYLELDNNFLIVKNNIQKRVIPGGSTGLGLKNIQVRYALLTEQKVIYTEDKQEFIVYIPLFNTDY